VRQTNRYHAAENAANREHQLQLEIKKAEIAAKDKSQDNRWEFRQSVYVGLLSATTGLKRLYARMAMFSDRHRGESEKEVSKRFGPQLEGWSAAVKQFWNAAVQAPLAMADDILVLVNEAAAKQPPLIDLATSKGASDIRDAANTMGQLEVQLQEVQLQKAGRRDLWGTQDNEAETEAAVR
jgi:hypothetical protein